MGVESLETPANEILTNLIRQSDFPGTARGV